MNVTAPPMPVLNWRSKTACPFPSATEENMMATEALIKACDTLQSEIVDEEVNDNALTLVH